MRLSFAAMWVSMMGCGGVLPPNNLRTLAESYPTASAERIKGLLDQLTVHDHFVLEFAGDQFKGGVFLVACEADPSITWTYMADGSRYDCNLATQEWISAAHLVGEDALLQNIELGRQDVIIYDQCQTGEIDQASCDLYRSLSSQIDAGAADTSQTIVNNMGDQCTIGQDPGCYP